MTATAHALVGGAIAASLPENPALGITLAALSHPLLDIIPHWDFGQGWRKKSKALLLFQGVADLSLGIILAFIFFGKSTNNLYLILAIFMAESWDFLQTPYWLLNWNFPPFSTFYNFGHNINEKMRLPWGILTQAVTVGTVVFALRFIH